MHSCVNCCSFLKHTFIRLDSHMQSQWNELSINLRTWVNTTFMVS